MSNKNYLDKEGLSYVWGKAKDKFVAQETGKGLSSNDYTSTEKTKLAGIAEGANKTVVENVLTSTSTTNALSAAQGKALNDKIAAINTNLEEKGAGDMLKSVYDTDADGIVDKAADADNLGGSPASDYAKVADIPTKVSQLANDAGYLNAHQDISGKADKATTLAGYGIADAYTKTATDSAIATAKQEAIDAILGGEVEADFDTLKEVAEWIQSDTTNSTALINRVSAIEADYQKASELVAITNAEIDAICV